MVTDKEDVNMENITRLHKIRLPETEVIYHRVPLPNTSPVPMAVRTSLTQTEN